MRNFRSFYWTMQFALSAFIAWAACEALAFAKDATPSSGEAGGGAWVYAYMIVLLVVSLGMIVVCKSSGRRDRAKPEIYAVESKINPKD